MATALESAEKKEESWGDKCYNLLKEYLTFTRHNFMTEEFRRWAEKRITKPPSLRAYGAVILRAAKNDLIVKQGYATVKNANAHACFATVWKSK